MEDINEYYYSEMNRLDDLISSRTNECDKFNRRREMAKHSLYNNDGFTNRITEGEDVAIKELKNITRIKKHFDMFTKEEWLTCSVLLEAHDSNIIKWCKDEFEYSPYISAYKGMWLYVFHNDSDAIGTKLRWA